MKRSTRKEIAQESVAIMERGTYTAPSGAEVDLRALIDHCRSGTVCYPPERANRLIGPWVGTDVHGPGHVVVKNETTLEGVRDLLSSGAV